VSRLLDGELTPARRKTIERHITECGCCGTLAGRLKKIETTHIKEDLLTSLVTLPITLGDLEIREPLVVCDLPKKHEIVCRE
jgi:hypothetical protein